MIEGTDLNFYGTTALFGSECIAFSASASGTPTTTIYNFCTQRIGPALCATAPSLLPG